VPPEAILIPQTGGSLGARLVEAVEQVDSRGAVIVIGTDAPLLGSAHALMAERQLREGWDACIVPALDGGYALIALGQPGQAPFALPPTAWGGPEVLRLTLQALQSEVCPANCSIPSATLTPRPTRLHFAQTPVARLRSESCCTRGPAWCDCVRPVLARSRHVYGVTSTPGRRKLTTARRPGWNTVMRRSLGLGGCAWFGSSS